MAASGISQRTDQHASIQKHDISIKLLHRHVEAILECRSGSKVEMSYPGLVLTLVLTLGLTLGLSLSLTV